jgi:hypothetical protein
MLGREVPAEVIFGSGTTEGEIEHYPEFVEKTSRRGCRRPMK